MDRREVVKSMVSVPLAATVSPPELMLTQAVTDSIVRLVVLVGPHSVPCILSVDGVPLTMPWKVDL